MRKADWTVLVYSAASLDLARPVRESFRELAGQAPQDVAVVGQMATAEGMERYELGPSMRLVEAGSADMSCPASLKDFLRWGMQRYPARHYALVLGGHGAGFAGALPDWKRSHLMSLPEMGKAVESAPVDLLVFNACLMAQTEVSEQLPVPLVVASQAAERGLGLPLGAWLRAGLGEPERAARSLVETCRGQEERVTRVSALRPSRELEASLDRLAGTILHHPEARQAVLEIVKRQPVLWEKPWDSPLRDQLDVGRLVRDLAADPGLSADLRAAAQKAADALPDAVLATTAPEGEGLSLFVPSQPWQQLGPRDRTVGAIYAETAWAARTRWDEMIAWLVEPARRGPT